MILEFHKSTYKSLTLGLALFLLIIPANLFAQNENGSVSTIIPTIESGTGIVNFRGKINQGSFKKLYWFAFESFNDTITFSDALVSCNSANKILVFPNDIDQYGNVNVKVNGLVSGSGYTCKLCTNGGSGAKRNIFYLFDGEQKRDGIKRVLRSGSFTTPLSDGLLEHYKSELENRLNEQLRNIDIKSVFNRLEMDYDSRNSFKITVKVDAGFLHSDSIRNLNELDKVLSSFDKVYTVPIEKKSLSKKLKKTIKKIENSEFRDSLNMLYQDFKDLSFDDFRKLNQSEYVNSICNQLIVDFTRKNYSKINENYKVYYSMINALLSSFNQFLSSSDNINGSTCSYHSDFINYPNSTEREKPYFLSFSIYKKNRRDSIPKLLDCSNLTLKYSFLNCDLKYDFYLGTNPFLELFEPGHYKLWLESRNDSIASKVDLNYSLNTSKLGSRQSRYIENFNDEQVTVLFDFYSEVMDVKDKSYKQIEMDKNDRLQQEITYEIEKSLTKYNGQYSFYRPQKIYLED